MDEYRRNPAIQAILIVESRQEKVAVWRRVEGEWMVDVVEGDGATVELPEIGTELPLREIYENLPTP